MNVELQHGPVVRVDSGGRKKLLEANAVAGVDGHFTDVGAQRSGNAATSPHAFPARIFRFEGRRIGVAGLGPLAIRSQTARQLLRRILLLDRCYHSGPLDLRFQDIVGAHLSSAHRSAALSAHLESAWARRNSANSIRITGNIF